MQRNYSLEAFHRQYYGTTDVAMAIYIDSSPRYILMEHLRGSFNATAPQTGQSEVEEGMVALKLNRSTRGTSWQVAPFFA